MRESEARYQKEWRLRKALAATRKSIAAGRANPRSQIEGGYIANVLEGAERDERVILAELERRKNECS
jgi:hypothetical protein